LGEEVDVLERRLFGREGRGRGRPPVVARRVVDGRARDDADESEHHHEDRELDHRLAPPRHRAGFGSVRRSAGMNVWARARSWMPAISSSESCEAASEFSRFWLVPETVVLSVQIATGTPTSRN